MSGYYVTETTTKVYYVESDMIEMARMDYSWEEPYYTHVEIEVEAAEDEEEEDCEDCEDCDCDDEFWDE